MAMGICRQGSLSGGELGREIPSAVRGTVQLAFLIRLSQICSYKNLTCVHEISIYLSSRSYSAASYSSA
ncbi:hypothetical protein Hanom_Chr01g00086801 [Helianthus anomalus]